MKRTTQTKADLLRANADLLRTNAALRQTHTRLHADMEDLNRQLLDEKNARKKDSKEADEAVEELGAIKNKVWRELVDLQASYRELQAENARIKSLHASSMEFIGTHIHFLKANVQ